jgi:hypothetical protein
MDHPSVETISANAASTCTPFAGKESAMKALHSNVDAWHAKNSEASQPARPTQHPPLTQSPELDLIEQ